MGIDTTAFTTTIAEYNDHAATGTDADSFGTMPGEKTPVLKAPFYAAKIVACAYGTNGGVSTDYWCPRRQFRWRYRRGTLCGRTGQRLNVLQRLSLWINGWNMPRRCLHNRIRLRRKRLRRPRPLASPSRIGSAPGPGNGTGRGALARLTNA